MEVFVEPEEKSEIDALSEILEKRGLERKTVDDWLNEIDYGELNSGNYVPKKFSLNFMNFIKLVNGGVGEENKTPVVHLAMMDKIGGPTQRITNLCFRGLGKTSLAEYLTFYIGVFGKIDGFGELDGMIYVGDSMENGVKNFRKSLETRYENSEFLQEWIPTAKFTDSYIEFRSKTGNRFGIKLFGSKSGIRGSKIFNKRPKLAILDDLVDDEDAKSKTRMEAIRHTITRGIEYALHPTKRKIVWNGTPFNKGDVLYEAVESGAWHVNVWPVCEAFPVPEEEFNGAWVDRFPYEAILEQYHKAVLEGDISGFNQEMMLRITSVEEKLVQEEEIRWYNRTNLLERKGSYNFYVTTDFATGAKEHNDFSVISVWAYNAIGDWFWVDGVCKKQTMDKSIDDLFRLVQRYKPQAVGVEVSGQQGAFINWLMNEMMSRNIWFNFAQGKNGQPGIRPEGDKLSRFNLVVPLFKAGKIYFPLEMKTSNIMGEFMQEIDLATESGLKSKHDDCIDTISMLMYLKPWKPSAETKMVTDESGVWDNDDGDWGEASALASYVV